MVTNRLAALPIFAVVMFIVYFVSVTTVGTWATDWANDGVFGDGFHLLGIGSSSYEKAAEEYEVPGAIVEAFETAAEEEGLQPGAAADLTTTAYLYDDEGNVEEQIPWILPRMRKRRPRRSRIRLPTACGSRAYPCWSKTV